MLSAQLSLKSSGCILSLALLGGITLSGGAKAVETAHAASAPVREQSWLTFSGPWLCRVWTGPVETSIGSATGPVISISDQVSPSPVTLAWKGSEPSQLTTNDAAGKAETLVSTATSFGATYGSTTIHCTRDWHVDSAGHIISEVPAWVPDASGVWPATSGAADWLERNRLPIRLKLSIEPPQRAKPKTQIPISPQPQPAYDALTYAGSATPAASSTASTPAASSAGSYNPWAPVPGHPTYSMGDFAGDPYASYFGYCTWYAWYRNQSEPLMRLGNAQAWAWNASSFGLHTGTVPVVGATAVFQPGVEGAGAGGHVGHVEAVLGGGWFIVSEMNFSWNGGGWGRVDWRYVYVTSGVTFVY